MEDLSLTALAAEISDARSKAEAHAQSLSHLHARLRMLEGEMTRRQQPPEDWE